MWKFVLCLAVSAWFCFPALALQCNNAESAKMLSSYQGRAEFGLLVGEIHKIFEVEQGTFESFTYRETEDKIKAMQIQARADNPLCYMDYYYTHIRTALKASNDRHQPDNITDIGQYGQLLSVAEGRDLHSLIIGMFKNGASGPMINDFYKWNGSGFKLIKTERHSS
jgi:hypothetical protein